VSITILIRKHGAEYKTHTIYSRRRMLKNQNSKLVESVYLIMKLKEKENNVTDEELVTMNTERESLPRRLVYTRVVSPYNMLL
jgi:hypothetical protein